MRGDVNTDTGPPSHGCTYCAIAMVMISTPFVYSFMMESKCCSRKDITMPANAPVAIVTEVTFNGGGGCEGENGYAISCSSAQ